MNSLKLTNFKAHQDLQEIKFNEENFLLYGDNGAGKSSIFEALKICFFKDRIETNIPTASTPEAITQNKQDFYSHYNNKINNQNFEVKINNEDFNSFNSADYNVYMLNLDDVVFENVLTINELLDKIFFNLPQAIIAQYKIIQKKANKFLRKSLENIFIIIDETDNSIRLTDNKRKIKNTKELKKYFNEAKLNLVIFALLFSAIEVSKDDTKKNILILDDFITSLDMSNRTFLMRHILDTFKNFQILIFTHNVYFYNLIMYLINDKICETTKEWQFANLYEIGNEHMMYIKNDIDTVEKLGEKYKPTETSFDIGSYGNELRKKFERLVYELSKIIMIGGVEDSNKILESIANQNLFLNHHGQSCCDLINDIERLIEADDNQGYIFNKINSQINRYKIASFGEIKDVLNTLKLYRKVSMHSLSHGQTGQHNWSDKEIKQTLILLKKLETNIKDLTNQRSN